MQLTKTITVDTPAEHDAILEKYPILQQSLLAASIEKPVTHFDWLPSVAELIDRVNPRFPRDSFSVPTIVHMIREGHILSVEEIDILNTLLPEYSGNRRIKISVQQKGETTITFEHTMKHSGLFYRVEFSSTLSTCFPITVTLTTFTDMDDIRNHHDECPLHCDEDTDCNCESSVALCGVMVVAKDDDLKLVPDWIEEHLFDGQPEDSIPDGYEDDTPQGMGWVGSDGLP